MREPERCTIRSTLAQWISIQGQTIRDGLGWYRVDAGSPIDRLDNWGSQWFVCQHWTGNRIPAGAVLIRREMEQEEMGFP